MNIPDPLGWIVVSRERGPAPCPHPHLSLRAAQKEAERLARQSPDDEFVIYAPLQAVKAVSVQVTQVELPDDDSIPF